MMKKIPGLLILVFLLATGLCFAQETAVTEQSEEPPTIKVESSFVYNPEGRRDPFRDLLGGREIKDVSASGEPQISIEDLILIGIVKNPKGYSAILSTGQGFPFFVRVGDRFSDGFVISINQSQAVFRKTHDRGIPLIRPRDIVKEINPEER